MSSESVQSELFPRLLADFGKELKPNGRSGRINSVKVAACQLDIAWENKEANYNKVVAILESAALPPGSLVILPEMFATGFSFNPEITVEHPGGATETFLAKLAQKYAIQILGGVVTIVDSRPRNQAVLFSPDGELTARYSKIFPFTGANEHLHHTSGTKVDCFSCGEFNAAMFICYDLRFPEIFRSAARAGAELLIVIANWPIARIEHWITLLQARAIENQAYVVGVNRSGKDPRFTYPGRSIIVDPHGNIMADAGSAEGMITADLDASIVRDWRHDFPALRDLRNEFLGG